MVLGDGNDPKRSLKSLLLKMAIYSDLMGFYSGLMGFYSDLMGFYSGLMGYEWDDTLW